MRRAFKHLARGAAAIVLAAFMLAPSVAVADTGTGTVPDATGSSAALTAAPSGSTTVSIDLSNKYTGYVNFAGFGSGHHTATLKLEYVYHPIAWDGDSVNTTWSAHCRGTVCYWGGATVWGVCSSGSSYGPLHATSAVC